jgi:hypothetical protein
MKKLTIFNISPRPLEEDLRLYDNDEDLPAHIQKEVDASYSWAIYSLGAAALIFFLWTLDRALNIYFS